MMIFIQLPYTAKAIYSHIDYRFSFISQQNQLLSAKISFLFYALFKAPLLAAFSALELLFSVSIPFELLASHPSLGSCNIFILNLPLPLKREGKKMSFSVNKKDCFPSKPVECSS